MKKKTCNDKTLKTMFILTLLATIIHCVHFKTFPRSSVFMYDHWGADYQKTVPVKTIHSHHHCLSLPVSVERVIQGTTLNVQRRDVWADSGYTSIQRFFYACVQV